MSKERLRLLFVEDHRALAENLMEYFGEDRYLCDYAADGLTALHLLATNDYDVVVMDVMLPGVSGMTICERIRKDLRSGVPVIMLTALDTIDDKIQAFGVGADDYLAKPFDVRELELRIQSLARRQRVRADELQAGAVRFNPGTLTVTLDGERKLVLSGHAASLFEALMRAYPNYLSYEALANNLWSGSDVDENTIRTHAYTLRKQLKQGLGRSMIRSLYGRGYQLDPDVE